MDGQSCLCGDESFSIGFGSVEGQWDGVITVSVSPVSLLVWNSSTQSHLRHFRFSSTQR